MRLVAVMQMLNGSGREPGDYKLDPVGFLDGKSEEEVNEVHPAPVKDEKAEVETVDVEIQHFTDDGTLIAPYPDYDNFADAFVYARRNLGWEEVTGEVQTFLWRGKKYHTEHKDQLHSDSTESDTATVNQ